MIAEDYYNALAVKHSQFSIASNACPPAGKDSAVITKTLAESERRQLHSSSEEKGLARGGVPFDRSETEEFEKINDYNGGIDEAITIKCDELKPQKYLVRIK